MRMPRVQSEGMTAGPVALPPPVARVRAIMLALFVVTVAALAFGGWVFAPFLRDEHRRLSPWLWLPMWLGELTALFWFVAAVVRPGLPPRATSAGRVRRRRAFLVSTCLALAADA